VEWREMNLRVIRTKSTEGTKWAVLDDNTGIIVVRGLDSEQEAIEFIRDQMALSTTDRG
jgi:hypothetical protein